MEGHQWNRQASILGSTWKCEKQQVPIHAKFPDHKHYKCPLLITLHKMLAILLGTYIGYNSTHTVHIHTIRQYTQQAIAY